MTKGEALQYFFSGFMDAYPASAVPENVKLPYLTYELVTGSWESDDAAMTVNMWFYTTSEAEPNRMAEELSAAIGYGGKLLNCDGGYIWLLRGSPWCQSLTDSTDPKIKRRYINITAKYHTLN